jgi:hypothetical protein
MKNRIQTIDLIDYITKPMSKEEIILQYRINNIIPERVELYLDFTESLYTTIINTYLGDDIMSDKNIDEHFNWCWEQVRKSFLKEKININSGELYDYFNVFFSDSFYNESNKSKENVDKIIEFFYDIFNFSKTKTKSDIESLIELYKIFENSLIK